MKVVLRNYFRNRMVNLTALSVKYFMPDAEFYCFTLYKQDPSEYDSAESLHPWIKEIKVQTKYVSNNGRPTDSPDIENNVTSGYANHDNVLFMTEWYNMAFEKFKDVDEKVLFLSEDHYFTSGQTLKEICELDFDVAYALWDKPSVCWFEANASIFCFVPSKLKHAFPVPEVKTGELVETIMGRHIVLNVPRNRVHVLSTRLGINYGGDGAYSNSSKFIEQHLKSVGII